MVLININELFLSHYHKIGTKMWFCTYNLNILLIDDKANCVLDIRELIKDI